MNTKRLVNLAGSLQLQQDAPSFLLQDGEAVPLNSLLNARQHNSKLVFDQGYQTVQASF